MTDITIEQSTFERLQRHARPLVDSTDTVINRALDAVEQLEGGAGPNEAPHHLESERRIDPRQLPGLKHTKVLDASIAGGQIAKPNWNLLLREILTLAMTELSDLEQVRRICPVNMVQARKEDDGYSYLPAIDISVQAQDANSACQTVVTAAQGLGVALEIGFMWRLKDDAAFPGRRARLTVRGTTRVA